MTLQCCALFGEGLPHRRVSAHFKWLWLSGAGLYLHPHLLWSRHRPAPMQWCRASSTPNWQPGRQTRNCTHTVYTLRENPMPCMYHGLALHTSSFGKPVPGMVLHYAQTKPQWLLFHTDFIPSPAFYPLPQWSGNLWGLPEPGSRGWTGMRISEKRKRGESLTGVAGLLCMTTLGHSAHPLHPPAISPIMPVWDGPLSGLGAVGSDPS